MSNPFFDHPILNPPYERPTRHWELDAEGQPTQKVIETRRRADFVTPIPKPRKRKSSTQGEMVFNEGKGLSTREQQPLAEKGSTLLETQYTGIDELRVIARHKDPRFMAGDMSSQGASEAGTYPFSPGPAIQPPP